MPFKKSAFDFIFKIDYLQSSCEFDLERNSGTSLIINALGQERILKVYFFLGERIKAF